MTCRRFPIECTRQYCRCITCDGCEHRTKLDEFWAWVEETGAVCSDPIWAPLFYEIEEGENGINQD